MKKICIIHTTPTTIASLKPLAASILENTVVYNFLDDSILPEINSEGRITESVRERVFHLIRAAAITEPNVILCACSTIGEVAEEARSFVNYPIVRIDEEMCRIAIGCGVKIGVAATLASTLDPTCRLISRMAAEAGKTVEIRQELINANTLLIEGKENEYDALVSERLLEMKAECDVVVLAQASMARALERLEDKSGYLSSPRSGMESLKCLL